MKHLLHALLFVLPALAAPAFAQDAAPAMPPAHGQPPQRDPKLEAAMKACREANKPAEGQRPDRAKLEACLKQKGFDAPPPPPRGEGMGPPPPPPPGDDAAAASRGD